ncbi:uncharacterized protein CANTADRAFT_20777 [Suhomyces tanzawaensis NRRL Y-17324]|uniref:Uncharacterized protein n=1 Tax=Suhomyces tanzawaensis NRRL Y-17324 TaxID=984487 RepID=A0A1E4SNZ4_9ASCO|nr:uncharacterized protein CANTADRAFT_20777 [Suhomyces tanzawaensis NRRL Y-17324]ODV81250.1 hypothetical protein CANTADRAFT_20777 [Suhomyces tanzawaensis NRRL Y-17324]
MSGNEWEWPSTAGATRPPLQPLPLHIPTALPSNSPSLGPLVPVVLPASFNTLHYSHINTHFNRHAPSTRSAGSVSSTSSASSASSTPSSSTSHTSGPRQVPSSMDSYENEFFSRLLGSISLNSDSVLLMHTTFALMAYFMRSNSFKLFASFATTPDTVALAQRLRRRLIRLSSKYYGLAIHQLRVMISTRHFNVATAVVVSSLLNKVSIYEYSDLHHSVTFSRGMVSIFNEVLVNSDHWHRAEDSIQRQQSLQDMEWITNYIVHASKAKHFPEYDPAVVEEYAGVLHAFGAILLQLHQSHQALALGSRFQVLVFHFNHLHNYTTQLQELLAENDITSINHDPHKLYKLLRHWLIIMPCRVHNIEHMATNPLHMTLMALYKCLSRLLQNLFPAVLFHFLQGFCGGVSLWTDSRYALQFVSRFFANLEVALQLQQAELAADSTHHAPFAFSDDQIALIYSINRYCLRVDLFFQKRSNVLALLFGDQRITPEIPPETIKSNLNEVMIQKFNSTNIHMYNFIHLPQVLKLHKSAASINNLHKHADGIYYYNKHHYQYFLCKDSDKVPPDLVETGRADPLLRMHIFNTTNFEIEDKSSKPSNEPIVTYKYFFEGKFLKGVLAALEQSYQELFDGKHENEPVLFAPHKISGLLANDTDPLLLANDADMALFYSRKPPDLNANHESSKAILNFYNARNDMVSQELDRRRRRSASKSGRRAGRAEEGADTEFDNFYDDLNQSYFELQ